MIYSAHGTAAAQQNSTQNGTAKGTRQQNAHKQNGTARAAIEGTALKSGAQHNPCLHNRMQSRHSAQHNDSKAA